MRKNKIDTIANLSEEQKKIIMDEIAYFFQSEFEEEIGILKQPQILDLFVEQLAPIVYNKALDDAMRWYKQQQDNMEADYYSLYKEVR